MFPTNEQPVCLNAYWPHLLALLKGGHALVALTSGGLACRTVGTLRGWQRLQLEGKRRQAPPADVPAGAPLPDSCLPGARPPQVCVLVA